MSTHKSLEGKVALVTGGSRGIGAAIVKRLAQEGAAVAFTYASSSQRADELVDEVEALGGKTLAIKADSADAKDVTGAVERTFETYGRFDILVNNAGVAFIAPLEEFTLEQFDRLVAVNVRGVFVAAQAAAECMTSGGRIITIGSTNADRVPFPGAGPYSMTKAAIVGLTKGLARDLGPKGITVNNVQPGPVDTDMNPAEGPFSEMIKTFLAVPRYGHADEIAGMVAYLAGDEAGYITGASLTIDGGFGA